MRDQHSIAVVASLHPKIRQPFAAFMEEAENALNITLRLVQGYRTFAQQQVIWNQGRDAQGHIINEDAVVTKSPPGASYHNYGLAGDVCPLAKHYNGEVYEDWKYDFSKLVPFATKHGFTWGGTFPNIKDLDHFENRMGYNWRDLLYMYHMKKFIPGTQYVNI